MSDRDILTSQTGIWKITSNIWSMGHKNGWLVFVPGSMPGCPNHKRSRVHHSLGMTYIFQPTYNASEFHLHMMHEKHMKTFIHEETIKISCSIYMHKTCQYLPMSCSRQMLWPRHLYLKIKRENYYKIMQKYCLLHLLSA